MLADVDLVEHALLLRARALHVLADLVRYVLRKDGKQDLRTDTQAFTQLNLRILTDTQVHTQ